MEGASDSSALPQPEEGPKFWVPEIIPEDQSSSGKPGTSPVRGRDRTPTLGWDPPPRRAESPRSCPTFGVGARARVQERFPALREGEDGEANTIPHYCTKTPQDFRKKLVFCLPTLLPGEL